MESTAMNEEQKQGQGREQGQELGPGDLVQIDWPGHSRHGRVGIIRHRAADGISWLVDFESGLADFYDPRPLKPLRPILAQLKETGIAEPEQGIAGPNPRNARIDQLTNARVQMLQYLIVKFDDEDWHGVMDAAADLRDIDSELKGLRFG